jgi:hypothetical protein
MSIKHSYMPMHYGGGGAPTYPGAILVYPSSTGVANELRLRIKSTSTSASARIIALGIPIPAILADIEQGVHGAATAAVLTAIKELEVAYPVAM